MKQDENKANPNVPNDEGANTITESTEAKPKPEATAIERKAKPTSRFLSKYQEEIPSTNMAAVV